jgi:hypothetical protein
MCTFNLEKFHVMKKLHTSLFVLVFLSLICVSQSVGQAKYDKMLKAAETNYEAGNYSKAFSGLEKFKKKAFKKLGQQNVYTPTYFMRKANTILLQATSKSLKQIFRLP